MPAAATPASPSSSEVYPRAVALLSQWEQARPAGSTPLSPELRTAFDQFVAEVLSDSQETNLDIADVQEVLRGATGLTIGRAEASGPGRALQAVDEATRHAHTTDPGTSPHGLILLSIQSRPDAELDMDELSDITETLLQNAGPAWEMIFGHGVVPGLTAEVRLTFLLAPVAVTRKT